MDSQPFVAQDWYLNDRTGRFEKYEKEDGHSNAQPSTAAARGEMTLKNEILNIIDTSDEGFDHGIIINDLASRLLNGGFLFNVDRLWNTVQSKSVENLIATLVKSFDNTEHNMAYLSSCLACVFRIIAEKRPFPAAETKFKVTVFVDVIRKYMNRIDYAMWKSWFLCDTFSDWFLFVTGVFTPVKNNCVPVEGPGLTEYFRMVKNCRYILSNNVCGCTGNTAKPAAGIFEETKSDFGDVKFITLEESECIQVERLRAQCGNPSRKTKHLKTNGAGRKNPQKRKIEDKPRVGEYVQKKQRKK